VYTGSAAKPSENISSCTATTTPTTLFAPSTTMNPRLPQHVVDKALAEDAPQAGA